MDHLTADTPVLERGVSKSQKVGAKHLIFRDG